MRLCSHLRGDARWEEGRCPRWAAPASSHDVKKADRSSSTWISIPCWAPLANSMVGLGLLGMPAAIIQCFCCLEKLLLEYLAHVCPARLCHGLLWGLDLKHKLPGQLGSTEEGMRFSTHRKVLLSCFSLKITGKTHQDLKSHQCSHSILHIP